MEILRRYFPRPFVKPIDEDLAFAVVTIVDEDEGWYYLRPPSHVWTSLVFTDDEVAGSLLNFALEQEENWYAQVQIVTWTPFSFTDDEIHVEPPFAGDDEAWLSNASRQQALVPDAVRDDEILSFVIEEAEPIQKWLATQQIAWHPVIFLDDETRSPVLDEEIVDETWRVLIRPWPDWIRPQLVADNELLSIPVEVIRTEPPFRGTIGPGIKRNAIWDYWNRLREEEDLMVLFDFNFDLIQPEPGKLPGDPSGPSKSP